MRFGVKLKALREAAGLTQIGLAEASGVPLGTIREYEQVKRDPLLATAVRLARALGVSVAEFEDCEGKDGPGEGPRPLGRPPKQQGGGTARGARARGRKA